MSVQAAPTQPRRPIRSYVRREGHMTLSQKKALERLSSQYELVPAHFSGVIASIDVFGREAPSVLEIGFGNGVSLSAMALAHPEKDFLGIEVYRPGAASLLKQAEAAGLTNLKVIMHDAVEVLNTMIPDQALETVQIFFPDPWTKNRHHKRRLIQTEFVRLVQKKLVPGGNFYLATDVQDYAEQMMTVITAEKGFTNPNGEGCFAKRVPERPLTKFEARGQRLGHGVWDLVFKAV